MEMGNGTRPRKVHSCRSLNTIIFWCFQAITSKGGYFLEAPVSGSKKPAEDGQLVILAAGEKVNSLVSFVISMVDVLRLVHHILFVGRYKWELKGILKLYLDCESKGIDKNSGVDGSFICLLSQLQILRF